MLDINQFEEILRLSNLAFKFINFLIQLSSNSVHGRLIPIFFFYDTLEFLKFGNSEKASKFEKIFHVKFDVTG